MKYAVAIVAALVLTAAGFGAGYWYRGTHSSPQAEMEDYAVTNVLGVLGYSHYLAKGETENLRELLNVNLNDHLFRITQYQGANTSSDFLAAKIRTLNAAAIMWDEHPPFRSKQSQPDAANAPWRGEWEQMTAKNFELLRWAQQQCSQDPSLKCRSPNKPLEPTR